MSYVVGVASQENHEENNNERLDLTHRIDPTSTDMLLTHETLLRAAISLKNQVVEVTWERDGKTGTGIDPTVYTGLLGTAFTCLRSYEVTGDEQDLLLCSEIVDTCSVSARTSSRHITFLCGRGGLYALGAVAASYKGDRRRRDFFLNLFLEIDEHVHREIMNHRSLKHPDIIRFKEVLLTPTHLAIVMEYAAGGELFERICNNGRFSEDEATFFFQQLISGVSHCHSMQICHRDLKLENTLLDGSSEPRLKICDFGYSKSSVLHSQPKSAVGAPAYIAPEVLSRKEYDGKIADVWSCGVTLYVMLVGAYPFEDPDDPRNFKKTIHRILSVHYSIPDYVRVSEECKHLLSLIFVANPEKRITIPEIKRHPWFLKNLPVELTEEEGGSLQIDDAKEESQRIEEISAMIQEARKPAEGHRIGGQVFGGSMDPDDIDADADIDDSETSGDFVCAL